MPLFTFRRKLKIINEFINRFVDRALSLTPEELEKINKSDESYTFLHALAGFTRDRKVLRDQLCAVLLAGRDTTAATLSWTFYQLSLHPDIVRKLRHEILTRLGPARAPTYADLKSMRYLQHTMNETLRHYPVIPYNVRVALHDTTLPRGGGPDGLSPIGIPKETPVLYSALTMQRRAELYPAASAAVAPPSEYSPDRWDNWTPKAWHYIPFNGGPRICIGQQFALTEMGYTIVRLLQRYESVELVGGIEKSRARMMANIVLQPADPLILKLTPAAKA